MTCVTPAAVSLSTCEPGTKFGIAIGIGIGNEKTRIARRIVSEKESVSAFLHAVRYNRNQRQLMEVPSSIPESFIPQPELVQTIVSNVLSEGREVLTEIEAKDPQAETRRLEAAVDELKASIDEILDQGGELGPEAAGARCRGLGVVATYAGRQIRDTRGRKIARRSGCFCPRRMEACAR